jgi:6-phosphogluconolactonase (cycloisomerase 2 family)
MKKVGKIMMLLGIIITLGGLDVARATSIDGTVSLQYLTNNYVLYDGDYAQGLVRFNNGFTVLPGATVSMDTFLTVSGGFDLGDTGALVLNGNLYLDGNTTLTSGGYLKGKMCISGDARTLFLGGDLTLSSTNINRVLHITGNWNETGATGDTIIDGQGHTLSIGDRAQIFVDTNVTLTLRNMTIKTGPKSLMVPAIQLAAPGSKLALDNVVLNLGADYRFTQGKLFIHDDVAVTGTSAFICNSPYPSVIASGATWLFDHGTTLSVAPASCTSAPNSLDLNSTETPHNFIQMADPTSVLYLNGCTLSTTYTGLQLTNGTILMNNHLLINTQTGVDISMATPLTLILTIPSVGMIFSPPTWSPNDNFLAVVSYSTNQLLLYNFSAGNATLVSSAATDAQGVYSPWGAAWSPDGQYIALIGYNSSRLQIYKFDGTSTLQPIGSSVITGNNPNSLAWSPEGKYIATMNSSDNSLQIFSFTGSEGPTLLNTTTVGSMATTANQLVTWSPDGKWLAIGITSPDEYTPENEVVIYSITGAGVPSLTGSIALTGTPTGLAWSPDGRYLAVADNASHLYTYRLAPGGIPVLVGSIYTGVDSYSLAWSPNGHYITVLTNESSTLQIYAWTGDGFSLYCSLNCASYMPGISWSPDGNWISIGTGTEQTIAFYLVNYVPIPAPQSFSASLVFGDSTQGSIANANVRLLGGAAVTIKGMVRNDSV